MRKRIAAMVLTLCLMLGLLPGTASAAQSSPPDWYFLFAIFKRVDANTKDKNGRAVHAKYDMSREEVNTYRGIASDFASYLTGTGVMRAHVDVVEIDTAVIELENSSDGGCLGEEQAAPLLKKAGVDLNQYDHITCLTSLNVSTGYVGLGGTTYENGTGHTCINTKNWEYCQENFVPGSSPWTLQVFCHEFLHFMENLTQKFGTKFDLHNIRIDHYTPDTDNGKECYTDIILNQARGNSGTGVHPAAWQFPPHTLRTTSELNIPSGVTAIGKYAFDSYTTLKKVKIPSTVTSIEYSAFADCTGLTEATMLPGVVTLKGWAFGMCSALTKVTIPASVTSIGECAFYRTDLQDVYYGGTEEQWKAIQIDKYNDPLTKAKIHYNSAVPDTCTVIFNAGGGSVSPKEKTYKANAVLGTLPTPTRAGYKFNGWYTAASGGKKVTSSTKVTADMTLYARWTKTTAAKTYTITLNANGGKVTPSSIKVESGKTYYSSLPTPTRTGYKFAGWYTAKTGGAKIASTAKATANRTVYAHWDKANVNLNHAVTFDPNGGTVYQTTKIVFSGATYRDLPTPTRSGYHFKGWYTKRSGGVKVTAATRVDLAGNQTLYAQWQTSASARSTQSGSWRVTLPVYYSLALYSSPTAAKPSAVVEEGEYQIITCTKKATLSNGTVRYYGKVNDRNYWFTYSCEMDV